MRCSLQLLPSQVILLVLLVAILTHSRKGSDLENKSFHQILLQTFYPGLTTSLNSSQIRYNTLI